MGDASFSGLRALIDELQRRRVFHVAVVYAVVSWMVIQVASIVFPALHLPEWTLTFVIVLAALGLPIALVLAWAFELTPEGVRRTDGAAAVEAPVRVPVARPRRAGVLASATLLAVAAAVGVWVKSAPAPAPTVAVSSTSVAVLPFSVRGSEELAYLADGMVNLLATKLDGAGSLRSVDARAVLGTVGQAGGGALDAVRGGMIAERLGAGLYVIGDLVEIERRLHLEASVYEPAGGREPVVAASVEGEAHELFRLVDELAARLLAGLNRGPGGRITRLAAVTTDSLAALKAYLDGDRHLRTGDQDSAVAAFARAVQIDTAFALGYYRLGVAWMARGDPSGQRIAESINQAAQRTERLTAHDRLLLEAASAWTRSEVGFVEFEGHVSEVETMYRRILGAYPDDVEAWFWLAELLFHNNPLRGRSIGESRMPWERVLAFEPHNRFARMHLARLAASSYDTVALKELAEPFTGRAIAGDRRVVEVAALRALALGDTVEEARIAQQLRRLPDENLAVTTRYLMAATRNPAGAARLATAMTDPARSAAQRAEGHALLAYLFLAQGRRRDAATHLDAVEAIDPVFGWGIRAFASLLPFVPTPKGEWRTLLNASESAALPAPASGWSTLEDYAAIYPELRHYLRGRLALTLGDSAAVAREVAALERARGPAATARRAGGFLHALRAHLAFAAGRPREAQAQLDSIRQPALFGARLLSDLHHQERLLRARLLRELGRDREALEMYGSLAEFSSLDIVLLAPSHLGQAEIHERLGDHLRAVEHYRRFLDVWRDADPELQPLVRDVRRRVERLTASQ